MSHKIEIFRATSTDKQTIGKAQIINEFGGVVYDFFTLELPWLDNKQRISCIPPGKYTIIKHKSPKFGDSYWVQDVTGRSEILIHFGNFYKNTLGCILPGVKISDIDKDGYLDVTSSKVAMNDILSFECDELEIF